MGDRISPPVFAALILLTASAFVAMLVFNAMASNPSISRGLFHHGIGNISAKYELPITPAGWAFSIWGVIYQLQCGWIVYSVANIFRRISGMPVFLSPAILSPAFFIIFILNIISNIIWLFTWDREYILQAAAVLAVTAFTCCLGQLSAYFSLDFFKEDLIEEGRKSEIVLIQVLVFNGLGMYGAWTTIATFLNLGSGLAYKLQPPVDQSTVSLFCLGAIAACFIAFFVLDLTILERYSRYTYSPYITLLWALAAIASKNWNPEEASSIVVAVLMGLGAVGLILKLVVSYWRHRQQPQTYRRLKVWATLGNEVYPSLSTK